MKKILFVTDSCADLPYNYLGDNVKVVPFKFNYKGEKDTLRDNRYEGKVNNTRRDTHLIESMGACYCEVLNTLNYATDEDMDVIVLYSSGNLDKHNKAAFEMATDDFKKNNMDKRVTVIDSKNISVALGLLFNKVIELYNNKRSYDEIVTYIVQNLDKYRFDIETDELSYYEDPEKMGFIDRCKLQGKANSSLLTIKGGKVVVAKRCNDLSIRREILIDRFVDDADLEEKAAIVYNEDCSYEADALRTLIQEQVGEVDIDIIEASRVSGTVIREYGLGLAYKLKK